MLVQPPMEALLPKTENRYTLAILAAKRTRQLVSGASPMAESQSINLVTLACEEIAEGKVVEVHRQVEPVVPIRPELQAQRITRQEDDDADFGVEVAPFAEPASSEPEKPAARPSMIKFLGVDDEMIPAETYFDQEESEFGDEDEDGDPFIAESILDLDEADV